MDMSDFERNYGENADSSDEDANIDKVRNAESEGSDTGGWATNITPGQGGKSKLAAVTGWFKSAAPLLGLAVALVLLQLSSRVSLAQQLYYLVYLKIQRPKMMLAVVFLNAG